jgi:cyclase
MVSGRGASGYHSIIRADELPRPDPLPMNRSTALALLALAFAAVPARAQQPAAGGLAVQVAPHAFVVTDHGRNLVLITGATQSLVAGVQEPALVEKARRALDALHASPVRYVVLMAGPGAVGFEDAGWGERGALTIAHEGLRYGIVGARRAAAAAAPATTRAPSMGFSEVVQIGMGSDEDAHLVKQPDGATGSDVAVHFERAGVLYLSSLSTDGYPEIDAEGGGTLSGLIKTVDAFATNFAGAPQAIEPIVPARGPLATLQDLRDFRDMLSAVRDRLNPLLDAGKSADDAVAAHPTAQFDARWGRGPVTPAQFVRAAFAALAKEREAPPTP